MHLSDVAIFHNKSTYEKGKEIDIQKTKTFFPLQIQAYERVILFLERIDPNNMIIRTHKNGMNAITLHMRPIKNSKRGVYPQYVSTNLYSAQVLENSFKCKR